MGLLDPGGTTYSTYAIPDPEAPYPHDFLIDPQGRVHFWSWEYEPRVLAGMIERLLGTTEVGQPHPPGGASLLLSAPIPNPTSTLSTLRLQLRHPGPARLTVLDGEGRLVKTLLAGWQDAGERLLRWRGRDEQGRPVPAGVYQIHLTAGPQQITRRVVLAR